MKNKKMQNKNKKGFSAFEIIIAFFLLLSPLIIILSDNKEDKEQAIKNLKKERMLDFASEYRYSINKYTEKYGLKKIEDKQTDLFYLFDKKIIKKNMAMNSNYKVRVLDENKSGYVDIGDFIVIKSDDHLKKYSDISALIVDCPDVFNKQNVKLIPDIGIELDKLDSVYDNYYGCYTDYMFGYIFLKI